MNQGLRKGNTIFLCFKNATNNNKQIKQGKNEIHQGYSKRFLHHQYFNRAISLILKLCVCLFYFHICIFFSKYFPVKKLIKNWNTTVQRVVVNTYYRIVTGFVWFHVCTGLLVNIWKHARNSYLQVFQTYKEPCSSSLELKTARCCHVFNQHLLLSGSLFNSLRFAVTVRLIISLTVYSFSMIMLKVRLELIWYQ